MANTKLPVQLYSFSQKIFNATTLELKFIATNSYEPITGVWILTNTEKYQELSAIFQSVRMVKSH